MAKIKNVVKVMNFQALLRMDKALKKGDKYRDVGKEITDILSKIMYNRNLMLDKQILEPDSDKPELNIYIANDYGFCGNFNSVISKQISSFRKFSQENTLASSLADMLSHRSIRPDA